MPNRRHKSRALGAVSQPAYTKEVDLDEFTKGILHFYGAGARVDLECSPDGGTTWFNFLRSDFTRGRHTLASPHSSFYYTTLPSLMRVFVDLADLNYGFIEGIREVA